MSIERAAVKTCRQDVPNIQALIDATSTNYVRKRDLGNASELQAAMIWATCPLQVTDLVSCGNDQSSATFYYFPERLLKRASACFPPNVTLYYGTVRRGTPSACEPVARDKVSIYFGYRDGFQMSSSAYSSVFYIGGESPTYVPDGFKHIEDPHLVTDWTGIAFENMVYSRGVLHYRAPKSSTITKFEITLHPNDKFKSRQMSAVEVAEIQALRPELVFPEGESVYSYLRSPFQDTTGNAGEGALSYWWQPATFKLMQEIVQCQTIRDEHILRARSIAHKQGRALDIDHYSKILALTTEFTGANPGLALQNQIAQLFDSFQSLANQVVPSYHAIERVEYRCQDGRSFLIISLQYINNSIVVEADTLIAQVVKTDDVEKSIMTT